jgi:hypothetical protein
VSTALAARPELDTADGDEPTGGGRWRWAIILGTAIVVVAGSAMRFMSVRPMWLDEAQGLMIARMPLVGRPDAPSLFQGLREDGAPPLYYLMLHYWTDLFGIGDFAVRSMSGVASVAALPIFWLVGRRLGGSRQIAHITLILAAANPWLIRYGSEARMYSLVVLLSLLVVLAAHRVWTQPSITAGALLTLAGTALLYTHYWGLFLLASVGVMAIVEFFQKDRRSAVISVAALAGVGVLFVPWVPSFLFQSAHTGTPWADRPHPTVFLSLLQEWSASGFRAAAWTAFLVWPLLIFGYGAISKSPHRIEIDLRGSSDSRWIAWLGALTLLIAYVACTVQTAAYTGRYTSVVIGLVFLLAAIGLARMPAPYTAILTVLLAGFWLAAGASVTRAPRSQSGVVADVLNAQAKAGDVIVFCPDQLGPSVIRLLHVPVERTAFPTGTDPARVNWVDYRQRNEHASATDFATQVAARTPDNATIWLVSTSGYRTYGDSCDKLQESFDQLRPDGKELIKASSHYYERAGLWRWTG